MSRRIRSHSGKIKRAVERRLRAEQWREAGFAANPGSERAAALERDELVRSLTVVSGESAALSLVQDAPAGNAVIDLLTRMAYQTLDDVFMDAAKAMIAHGLNGHDYAEKLTELRPSPRDFGIAKEFIDLVSAGKSKRDAAEIVAFKMGIVSGGFDGACEEVIRTAKRVTDHLFRMKAARLARGEAE